MLSLTIPPWMVSQTQLSPMVTKLGPRGVLWCAVWRQAPSLLAGRGRLCPGLRPAQSEKVMGTVFSNLLRSQPEKDPFWWKWTENAAKIKHRLQPCRSAQQSVIIEFSLALILSGFTTTYLTQDYNKATWPPVGLPPYPSPAVPQGPQSSSDPAWVSQPSTRGCPAS